MSLDQSELNYDAGSIVSNSVAAAGSSTVNLRFSSAQPVVLVALDSGTYGNRGGIGPEDMSTMNIFGGTFNDGNTRPRDDATMNIFAGTFNRNISPRERGTLNVNGGTLAGIVMTDAAQLNVTDGQIWRISARLNARLNISGGTFPNQISTSDRVSLDIPAGQFGDGPDGVVDLRADGQSVTRVFGSNFNLLR